jgi:hypothetical protein
VIPMLFAFAAAGSKSGMIHALHITGALLMTLLLSMVVLLVGALVSLLGWPPKTTWGYAPAAACGGLAVVIALAICWIPL